MQDCKHLTFGNSLPCPYPYVCHIPLHPQWSSNVEATLQSSLLGKPDDPSDRLALQWASRDEVLYDLLYSNDPTATFDPTAWSILTNGVSGTESSTEIFLPDFQGQSWSMVAPWWVFRLREQ